MKTAIPVKKGRDNGLLTVNDYEVRGI